MSRFLFRCLARTAIAAATYAHIACAQGTFQVVVHPQLVAQSADSISMAYTVVVAPPTSNALVTFIVDAPTLLHADLPGPHSMWLVLSRYIKRPVGSFTRLDHFTAVGDSTPPLALTSRGILGIVPFWAEMNAPADTVISDSPADTSAVYDTLIVVKGMQGSTVGVVNFPADLTASGLTNRLSRLIAQACTLGWVDSQTTCSNLQAKVAADATSLNALLTQLSAQRGKHVSEAAYLLISQNASYILTRL
jgi:hypothetical protein